MRLACCEVIFFRSTINPRERERDKENRYAGKENVQFIFLVHPLGIQLTHVSDNGLEPHRDLCNKYRRSDEACSPPRVTAAAARRPEHVDRSGERTCAVA